MSKLHSRVLIRPPKITISYEKKKFIIVKWGKNIIYHLICAKICRSGEFVLWRVNLALFSVRSMVSYFPCCLDQVGALLPLFNLYDSNFILRQ
jgi:hypothetical protein